MILSGNIEALEGSDIAIESFSVAASEAFKAATVGEEVKAAAGVGAGKD